jgi:hypothetical protein
MKRLSAHILVFTVVATAVSYRWQHNTIIRHPSSWGAVEFTTSCSPQPQTQFNRR